MHRVILGIDDSEILVDHIDRNPLNNRRSNLRLANKSTNAMNCNTRVDNTSEIIGVSFRKDRDRWRSYITLNSKTRALGNFKNKDDAIKARLEAEVKYFGEFAPQKHLYEQFNIEEVL